MHNKKPPLAGLPVWLKTKDSTLSFWKRQGKSWGWILRDRDVDGLYNYLGKEIKT